MRCTKGIVAYRRAVGGGSSNIFDDDFSRAADPSSQSLFAGGNWSVTSGFADTTGSGEAQLYGLSGVWCVYDESSGAIDNADNYTELTIASGLGGDIAGLFSRYSDTSNFYVGRCSSVGGTDQYQIYKRVGGTYTLLDSLTESFPSQPFRIRFEVQGTSLSFQLWNGSTWVEKCSATDSALSSGSVGMFGQQVTGAINVDDFAAGDL